MIKPFTLFFSAMLLTGDLCAGTSKWDPVAGHVQIPIWPGEPPDSQPVKGPEFMSTGDNLVAGRSWFAIERVSQPSMTIYSPKGHNTGIAVIVFPGGGYTDLAIDLEGTEICDWLNSIGITAILLKYRVPGSEGYARPAYRKSGPFPRSPIALQDAQRTLGLVRSRANEWGIDRKKIGVIGFSAGGHLVAAMSTQFSRRLYRVVDTADEQSCRPDFAIAVYPGHLWNWNYEPDPKFELNPDIPVSNETPPTFLLQAEDDPVDDVQHSLVYYIALKKAGVPVEMHLYAEGGHAFGLRSTKFPISKWPHLVQVWLRSIGMIAD